jgi:hypothetical protein
LIGNEINTFNAKFAKFAKLAKLAQKIQDNEPAAQHKDLLERLKRTEIRVEDFHKRIDIYQFHDLLFRVEKADGINKELLARVEELTKCINGYDARFEELDRRPSGSNQANDTLSKLKILAN